MGDGSRPPIAAAITMSTKFGKVQRKRMQKLIDFLWELKPGRFFFGNYIQHYIEGYGCGTVACALGWCPAVFPRHWGARRGVPAMEYFPVLKGKLSTFGSAIEFFGLDAEEADALFYSERDGVGAFGGDYLWDSATPKQVARNLKKFLVYKENNK